MKTVSSALAGLMLSSSVLFSCDNQDKKIVVDNGSVPAMAALTLPASPTLSTPVTATPAGSKSADKALNPKHGEPGHRCDIPVGAPLDSPPSNQSKPTPPSASSAIPTPASAGSGKLNPKHGEPGHRCDIPVGSPLDSKPASASPASKPQPATSVTPAVAAAPATGTGPLNPKHGEPGHRCDIPVGAPLNSEPSQVTASSPATPEVQSTQASQPAATNAATALPKPTLRLPGVNAPSSVTSANPKYNPKHGEPGHRCDIKVGALLN
jgi:hypothetical protein